MKPLSEALLIAGLLVCASACRVPPDAFRCSSNAACVHDGQPGICESTGACSATDPTCPSGHRYLPEFAPGLGSSCVGSDVDASVPSDDLAGSAQDAGLPDASVLDASQSSMDLAMPTGPIVLRGSTSILPVSGRTSIDVALPSGTVAGDFVIVAFIVGPTTVVPTVPAAWKKRAEKVECDSEGRVTWYSFIQGSGDPSTYTLLFSGTADHSTAIAIAYGSTAPTATPRSESLAEECVDPGQIANTNSIAAQAGDRLIAIFASNTSSGETWSTPSGMTPLASTGLLAAFDQPLATDGATGARSSSVYGHSNGPAGGYYAAAIPHR